MVNWNEMNTHGTNYCAIEDLICKYRLTIKDISFAASASKMLVCLNTESILFFPLSLYPVLSEADSPALRDFRIIAGGTGVHWPALDEDLSLKGFLKDALVMMINGKSVKVA